MKRHPLALMLAPLILTAGCRSRVPPPVNVNQTLVRHGAVYQIHDPEPYTGELAAYDLDGRIKMRAKYRQGLLDGVKAEFRSDGQPLAVSHWKAGRKHGAETDWYENGQKSYEGIWEEDRPAGVFQGWYPDGRPAFHVVLKYGAGKGRRLTLAWNDTIVKAFQDVLIDGPFVEYHKVSGRVTRQELYRDGILIEKRN